ncbi:MAG: HAD family hydrolase [Methanomassiliicoccus sp.]|jgi:putative hydrolase of the HAD superfamily|nr:HAD family hydrolase [Methanomassiliicoccus sp.]
MKAVIFDLGHTLIDYYDDWTGPEERVVNRIYDMVASISPSIDREEFTAYLSNSLRQARDRKSTQMIEVPLVDLMGECLERYGALDEYNLGQCLELFYNALQEDRKLVAGAIELLHGLKERGMSIGLISDVAWGLPSEYSMRDIQHFGLDQFFDDYVFSTDVGLRKPHPKVFKIALSNLGVTASEAMYIGNSLAHDIKGAKGVGMRAVLKRSKYCPPAEVEADHVISSLDEVEALID